MKYEIRFTQGANADLAKIARYIEYDLENPLSANQIVTAIAKKCYSLIIFPKANLVRGMIRGQEYRFTHACGYTIVYTVDTEARIVLIRAVIHSRADIESEIKAR